ncbi:segregation and condensation protein A [Clostridium acetireducens DSM 10703]|jgi:segregation and condensation protein A|uniref:Segregation and condensation protein A n=1 Tax=Clostridium acetireducens DSM 10703 TaxID=1121290 RepID=A0A1E8F1U1_9CLOT|nr:segregation/condensation protein A [Clostridium acetireducens]OFI07617.1 segregation and condensation protein A [Clostridium acetireducens DSM 10703]
MTLNIKIHNFEGPFDLLLHLIKKNKMDIYHIQISEITNQYIIYLQQMKSMDLEVTSEFIVMASSLLEIKSKMLIPKPKLEEQEEKEEEDPREQLVNKLLEYKKFKKVAEIFKEKEKFVGIMFHKKPEIIEIKEDKVNLEELFKNIDLLKLYDIYNKLINTYKNKINEKSSLLEKNVFIDKFKIEDKIQEIRTILKEENLKTFSTLIRNCSFKIEIIVTFLAILEMAKLREIKILQEDKFKEIYLERM